MRKIFKKTTTALSLFLMPLFLVSCLTVATAFKGNLRSNTTYADVFQASMQAAGEANFKVVSNDIKTGLIVAEQVRESFKTTYFRMNITVKKVEHGTAIDVSVEPPQDVVGDTEAMFNNFAKALKNKVPDVAIVSSTKSLQAEKDQKQASKIADMTYDTSFDKVWKSVNAVIQGEGLEVKAMDKSSGFIAGTKGVESAAIDIMTGYSTRFVINISVEKMSVDKAKVSIVTKLERSHEGKGWVPANSGMFLTRANRYNNDLYDKIQDDLKNNR